jgi:futalosine hydrolase
LFIPGAEAQNPDALSGVPETAPVALIAAVRFELEPLREKLLEERTARIGGRDSFTGLLDGRSVVLIPGGMGKVNAAQATTALLEHVRIRGVINFGVAGSYPGAGASVASVALATSEAYGDEGVDAPDRWLSTRDIGIPLLEAGGMRYFNVFPLDTALVDAAREQLRANAIPFVGGPFVTVSSCSGTARRGAELHERFAQAVCESMEGAAVAHVCALYGVPFMEVRGISNLVKDRDLVEWRLEEAALVGARAARALVPVFDPNPLPFNPEAE